MNFVTLAQKVRQEVGVAGTGPTDVTGQTGQYKQIIDWVAQAYEDIQNKYVDWKFLWAEDSFVTVAGTATYTLAADIRQINEDSVLLTDASGGQQYLTYIEYDDYRRNKLVYTDQSQPWSFTIQPDGKMRLLAVPDAVYTIDYEYWKVPDVMTLATDNPIIPSHYHDAIKWQACVYWANFQEATEELRGFVSFAAGAMMELEANQLPAKDQAHSRAEGVDIVVVAE